jgi:hypothetical protein
MEYDYLMGYIYKENNWDIRGTFDVINMNVYPMP